jgi:hypothetical protein
LVSNVLRLICSGLSAELEKEVRRRFSIPLAKLPEVAGKSKGLVALPRGDEGERGAKRGSQHMERSLAYF